jgi:hypothetical protein
MTSPHHDRPTPGPAPSAGPDRDPEAETRATPKPSETTGGTSYADRAYRSITGVGSGVLLLVLVGWIGADAIVRGNGHTPWLAMAGLLFAVPLIVAFTIRPAVFANEERVRVRNPFRTITLPWAGVDSLRAAYSTELFAGGRKYQLWAIPVSLRARKRAARQDARARAGGEGRAAPFGVPSAAARRRTPAPGAGDAIRSGADQALAELRDLLDRHSGPAGETARPAPAIRWAYEVIAPALAGAIVFAVLLAVG